MTSSSAMAETARRVLQYSNLMTGGVGLYCDVLVAVGFVCCQFSHDCRLKGNVSRQYLWTVRWGNGYTTTLTLEVSHRETL